MAVSSSDPRRPATGSHTNRAALAIAATMLLLAGCASDVDGPARQATADAVPRDYAGDDIQAEYVVESRYVEVRDGTRLAVDIIRPASGGKAVDGRFPLVWMHTPYRRARLSPGGTRVSILAGGDSGFLHLVDHGYVVAVVDTRGRGASFGTRRGFLDRTEALDAYDMTEWFAAQPWSNGKVGIAGCSYNGASTLHAATTAPPHLKAIAPGCFAFDSYRFVARGGILAQFNTRPEDPQIDYGYGVAPVDEDDDGRMAASAIEMHRDNTPMAELWRGMPYRDDVSPLLHTDFWRETSAATYIETIEKSGVAIFMWGNWRDEGSFQQVLAFNNLDNPRRLWMGGWGHCEVGDYPMRAELLRFFDFYLKGIDNGWEDGAPVTFYTIGAAPGTEWSSADAWPPRQVESWRLRLAGDAREGIAGQLRVSADDAAGEIGRFTVDYAPVCSDPDVDMYFLFRPCVVDEQGIAFQTASLTRDLHVLGHPMLDLQVSVSTNDADLFAYLEAVAPDGKVEVITHGRLRVSHRKESDAPIDYFGIPYHSGLRDDVLTVRPGEMVRMRFDLLPTSTVVKAGSRVRLRLTGADPRQRFRTLEFDPPPVITVHSRVEHPSVLTLPVTALP